MSDAWDEETDVVVLGYGGAGAAAAISAHDAGARVVIVEKTMAGAILESVWLRAGWRDFMPHPKFL
ncbi:MAG: FAD-binding protein [Deltaproteobacteria bacterium]|nr:FAD-binding protein [Deltaproteobacteria bacterium]